MAQSLIFVASAFVVRRLYLEPYLAVRRKREELTAGRRDDAIRLKSATEKLLEQYSQKLSSVRKELQDESHKNIEKVKSELNALISAKEQKNAADLQQKQEQASMELKGQETLVESRVGPLADEFFNRVVG